MAATDPDIIAEECGLGHIEDHGDPRTWRYLGKRQVPATEPGRPPGSKKIYEESLDDDGKQIEWHHGINPDGILDGGTIASPGTTSRAGLGDYDQQRCTLWRSRKPRRTGRPKVIAPERGTVATMRRRPVARWRGGDRQVIWRCGPGVGGGDEGVAMASKGDLHRETLRAALRVIEAEKRLTIIRVPKTTAADEGPVRRREAGRA